jgi:uncharacterized membrane protein
VLGTFCHQALPQNIDLVERVVESAAGVNHNIGDGKALLIGRLCGNPIAGGCSLHASKRDQSLDPLVDRCVYNDHERELLGRACFDEQWNVIDDDCVRVRGGDTQHSLSIEAVYFGVHDRVEVDSCCGIREHHRPQRRAVESAVRADDRVSESAVYRLKALGSLSDSVSCEYVSIDHCRPESHQTGRHHRFAGGDTAGEPDHVHGLTLPRVLSRDASTMTRTPRWRYSVLELLAGTGLAVAAGLNAYVPLLVLGLSGRFLDFVELPVTWAWLENEWVLLILGVLLVIEFVADKIPAVDSVNDWIQSLVRPASGGIVFGTGAATQTAAIADPAAFFESNAWVPVVTGVAIALAVHVAKMLVRPAANALTAGAAAPVLSTIEDIGALMLSLFAILSPVFVVVAIIGAVVALLAVFRRVRRRRQAVAPA